MNEDLFHENVQLFGRSDPKKAVRLQFLRDTPLTISPSKCGAENLVKGSGDEAFYYHDADDPVAEAEAWFKGLDLRNISVIYVYGIGLGYYYDAAEKWLQGDPKRGIVFLENNLYVIQAFLQTGRANRLLKDPQAYLSYFEDTEKEEESLKEIYWDFILTQMTFTCLKSYGERYPDFFAELKHQITHAAAIKNGLVEEYLRYGISFFKNYYPNLLWLPESWRGTHLYGKFENIPAIICGAGPSLEKNILSLQGYLDKALLFGGGSALNALSSRGILPHFGIGVDPNPTQHYRLSSNKAYEVPLFYRNRMHVEAYRLVHGPRLYIPGAGGYDIADWFDEKFGLKDEGEWLDEGHNVVNFGLELAYHLGCNPILFVGVDLAFTEMQSYASGIVDDTTVQEKDILNTDDFDTSALLKKDIYGRPIYTLWKWISESEWTTDYAKSHPQLTIINCTEGGLGMPQIPNMPLKEAAERYLTKSYDLRSRVQGEILNSGMPEITDERVFSAVEEMDESLKRSVEQIETLLQDKSSYEKKLKETKSVPDIKQSGLAALAEIELEEEPAYTYILGIFNLVYSRVLNRDLRNIQREHLAISDWERELHNNEINTKRLAFMLDVARVNRTIINESLEERLGQLNEEPCDDSPPLETGESEPEFGDQHFIPVRIPHAPKNLLPLGEHHHLRIHRNFDGVFEYAIYKGDTLDGEYRLTYPSGITKLNCFYKEGALHGSSIFYGEDGTVLTKSLYVLGKQTGTCRWQYPSGKLYSIQHYSNGVWHGKQVYWYENGRLKTEMEYSDGKIDGKVKLYFPQGKLKRELDFSAQN